VPLVIFLARPEPAVRLGFLRFWGGDHGRHRNRKETAGRVAFSAATLTEEKKTDDALTKLADSEVNAIAQTA
jgi:hypothetical protein